MLFRLIRRIAVFSRPRTASQGLALGFVAIAIATLCVELVPPLSRAQQPHVHVAWITVVVLLALVSRMYSSLRPLAEALTFDRVRVWGACIIFFLVAGSLSWHFASLSLGMDGAYGLLGPASGAPEAFVVYALLLAFATVLLRRIHVIQVARPVFARAARALRELREQRLVQTATIDRASISPPELVLVDDEIRERESGPAPRPARETRGPDGEPTRESQQEAPSDGPPIDVFVSAPKSQAAPSDLGLKAQRIEETLASFNVAARVVDHHYGPTVTQFDVQPERGVKVRRITELQNDLALALAAPTIRIQAPVPGKSVVGIEIPNTSATTVTLRELLESEAYRELTSPLKVVLGKDVAGRPGVIDLARMPHLLIAGATGSGKSACVNALISCILYQATPEEVRLLMVDPKMVELTVYNGVPHLLSPVVTEMDKVVGVLQWAIREMERRYQLFKTNGVRNITRFNEKADEHGVARLPYIVLIVDELADLMMVAPEDVEEAICRLAQLARAAGIHLVIATQRPSVDVVTGLIKANFPARIAFAMTSQVDSRTILDTAGAEKLLGRGDMLYQPPDGPKPVRLQGSFVSDREVEALVEFWQGRPVHAPRVAEEEFAEAEKAGKNVDDDLLEEATRLIQQYQHVSVSLLQRLLKVGYSRAARLMDQLETRGVVGPPNGSKQRPVVREDALTEHVGEP